MLKALPNYETIKWSLLPSRGLLSWQRFLRSNGFDPESSLHIAVDAYRKSNFGLLRAIMSNAQMFEHLSLLRKEAVERQYGKFSLVAHAKAILILLF